MRCAVYHRLEMDARSQLRYKMHSMDTAISTSTVTEHLDEYLNLHSRAAMYR